MTKTELMEKLDEKVKETNRFIGEVLFPRNDTSKPLLSEFRNVLSTFQKNHEVNGLKKLREIDSRPVPEGRKTDYTAGMSLSLDGDYKSLAELILEIEDLVFEIEKLD